MICTMLGTALYKCSGRELSSSKAPIPLKIAKAIDIILILGAVIVGALGMAHVIHAIPMNASWMMTGAGGAILVVLFSRGITARMDGSMQSSSRRMFVHHN